MKKIVALIGCLFWFFVLVGQEAPIWLNENARKAHYPDETFYTGFVYNIVEQGKSVQDLTVRTKADAQADLIKKIRLKVEAKTQNNIYTQSVNGKYDEGESFSEQANTSSNAEIVGVKTEFYYDKSAKTVYAFAYANKYELIGYYKSTLLLISSQVEGLLKTAKELEANKEKAKARQQCQAAKPLLDTLHYAQSILIAIDANVTPTDLQQQKIEQLRNEFTQMQARLAQGVYVYMESDESVFNEKVDIVANKLKAELATKGCSFTDSLKQSDFYIKIKASTRNYNTVDGIVFCYADVKVELIKTQTNKTVYQDLIEEKSGHISADKAARKALENVSSTIVQKISTWISN